MMAPIFCTACAVVLGASCLSVRLAASRHSGRCLPWSAGAFVFLAAAGCGMSEILS